PAPPPTPPLSLHDALPISEVFVELGPSPTLLGLAKRCLAGSECAWLPSLKRGRDDHEVLQSSLAALYVRGVEVDWRAVDAGRPRRPPDLPTHPFRRSRCWTDPQHD